MGAITQLLSDGCFFCFNSVNIWMKATQKGATIVTTFERDMTNNIRIHVLPTNRFKTFSISLSIGIPLSENTITSTALIPYVLRRGTKQTPDTLALREQLDDMYGAGFGFNVAKRGDTQFVQFRMDVINDRFVDSEHSLLAEALAYLGELITQPLVEENGFKEAYVEAEKQTLKKQLESVINDKIRYASERCIEEMCADEPYRLNALGKIEDIPSITAKQLYEQYNDWLEKAMIDLHIVGDTTIEDVKAMVEKSFQFKNAAVKEYGASDFKREVKSVKTIVDQMDVNQGKLNLGLRTNISYASEQYAAMLMYNGILGGFPHSKLFVNVREKESLAYYCASRLDGHKGICTIQSGIEFANYEKALKIIEEQLASMKSGNISEVEISQTKAMLTNALNEMQDSANEMIAFDFNNLFAHTNRTAEEIIAKIQAVTIADIVAVAEQVQLDTIYFLRNRVEVS